MKRGFEIVLGLASILLFIAAINLIANSRSTGADVNPGMTATPAQGIEIIRARLKQLGVPIQGIKSVASPDDIEITVQKLNDEAATSPDDQWNLFLASREATLAYLRGFRVASYSLRFAKTNGEIVDAGKTFLYPTQFSQQLSDAKSAGMDDATTKDLIEKNLTLNKLKIVSLQVNSDNVVRANTKFVDLVIESSSNRAIADINSDINSLINHLLPMVKDLEAKTRPNISLVRIQIKDEKGNYLLHYIYDFDTYTQSWSLAKGLEGSWDSKSVPVMPQAPNSTPTLTPSFTPRSYP
jgi:hypothetical protein